MINDPTIERVRKARRIISKECGHDPERLIQYYIQRQNKRIAKQEKQTNNVEKIDKVTEIK